jgi:hypothetical protein
MLQMPCSALTGATPDAPEPNLHRHYAVHLAVQSKNFSRARLVNSDQSERGTRSLKV